MQASCQCGGVTFTTSRDRPQAMWFCHCLDCQKQSSSAFATSTIFPYFEAPSEGESLHIGCWTRKTEAGNTLFCYFCKQCGSRLIHQSVLPDGTKTATTTVKASSLEERLDLPWTSAPHIWTRSALVNMPKGAQTFQEEPPSEMADWMDKQRA